MSFLSFFIYCFSVHYIVDRKICWKCKGIWSLKLLYFAWNCGKRQLYWYKTKFSKRHINKNGGSTIFLISNINDAFIDWFTLIEKSVIWYPIAIVLIQSNVTKLWQAFDDKTLQYRKVEWLYLRVQDSECALRYQTLLDEHKLHFSINSLEWVYNCLHLIIKNMKVDIHNLPNAWFRINISIPFTV